MKSKWLLLLIFVFVEIMMAQFPVTRVQMDWHSGSGLTDTTGEWMYRYARGGGLNDAVAPLVLLMDSTSIVYAAWVAHTIDNSPEIGILNWCIRPALINGDDAPDIVANIQDNAESGTGMVVWYEAPLAGWVYTRHDIYTYTSFSNLSGAYPADIDHDGYIDVVAGDIGGLYWFENDGSGGGWAQHTIYTPAAGNEYHPMYYDIGDADGDGWLDVLMTGYEGNASVGYNAYTTIYWGNGTFPHFDGIYTVVNGGDLRYNKFWRAIFFDPDPIDGFLDIAYEKIIVLSGVVGIDSLIVATQSPARTFTRRYSHIIDVASNHMGHDGLWNNDFDEDGDEDLVVATADNDCASWSGCDNPGYFFLVESDPGDAFTYYDLFDDPHSTYGDGAIMHDMDGDGKADVIGTCDSVGYFRHTGTGYTDFSLFPIDNIPGTGYTTHFASHWVFPYNLDGGGDCTGDVDIDLIVSFDNGIRIYENQMLSYLPAGTLYSAILGIPLPYDTCVVCSLYWDGCDLTGYAVNVSARMGTDLASCSLAVWSAPASVPYNDAPHGWYVNETSTHSDTIWVQYRILVNRGAGGNAELSPFIDSVWVSLFESACIPCPPAESWIICPLPCGSFSSCPTQVMIFGIRDTTGVAIDTNRVYFTVIDVHPGGSADTTLLFEPSSEITFSGWASDITATVSGSWANGDSVHISLDSLYNADGCLTIP